MGQKGAIAQLLILVILAAGLIGGLYLVKHPQIFKPKAGGIPSLIPETSFALVGPRADSGRYPVGSEFDLEILVRSDITEANLFTAKLTFPKDLIEVVRIEKDHSFITQWVEENFDNAIGTISLVGGVPNPGYKTAIGSDSWDSIMATIIFRVKAQGSASIDFTDQSVIYSNSNNINILVNKTGRTIKLKPDSVVTIPEKSITYNLAAGWNGIGISISDPDQSPAQALEATEGKCTEIQGFNPATAQATFYTSQPEKQILNSLDKIVGGQGYLLKCTAPASLILTGPAFITTMPNLVVSNVQYISVPRGYNKTAEQFLTEVSDSTRNCTEVDRYVAGGWEGHIKGLAFNNFQMNDKESYNVKCGYGGLPSPTPAATPAPGTGDGNNDGKINLVDLSILLSDFHKNRGFRTGIDLNGDGVINAFDFSLMKNLLIERHVIKG